MAYINLGSNIVIADCRNSRGWCKKDSKVKKVPPQSWLGVIM